MAILRGQRGGNDCGPTCFANALNILGYDIKISQANELCNLAKDGTDGQDLTKAFNKYGFNCKEKIHYSPKRAWDWLIRDTNRGLPIIIGVDNGTHWLLVLRAGRQEAQILDPESDNPNKVSKEKLLHRWKYIEDGLIRPKYEGLKIAPFKNKSIKAVLLRKKILATIDVK